MSEPIKALAAQASLADTRLSWRDYLELTKPRWWR